MSDVVCLKHRTNACGCFKPRSFEYQPKQDNLMKRKNALEVFYATMAFPENLAYSPFAMREMAWSYLTVAEALARLVPPGSETERILTKAGFREE